MDFLKRRIAPDPICILTIVFCEGIWCSFGGIKNSDVSWVFRGGIGGGAWPHYRRWYRRQLLQRPTLQIGGVSCAVAGKVEVYSIFSNRDAGVFAGRSDQVGLHLHLRIEQRYPDTQGTEVVVFYQLLVGILYPVSARNQGTLRGSSFLAQTLGASIVGWVTYQWAWAETIEGETPRALFIPDDPNGTYNTNKLAALAKSK